MRALRSSRSHDNGAPSHDGGPVMGVIRSVLLAVAAGTVVLGAPSAARADKDDYRIFRPDGSGPHPAIVFASGCSGFAPSPAPKAYERAAETFRTQGFVVASPITSGGGA
jgi:hypothetical protein